jgi:hypothetical protein
MPVPVCRGDTGYIFYICNSNSRTSASLRHTIGKRYSAQLCLHKGSGYGVLQDFGSGSRLASMCILACWIFQSSEELYQGFVTFLHAQFIPKPCRGKHTFGHQMVKALFEFLSQDREIKPGKPT